MTRFRLAVFLLSLAIVAFLVLAVSERWRAVPIPSTPSEASSTLTALPEISPTPFLNDTQNITYVGAAVCAECHAEAYESYLRTAHSHAFGNLDPSKEPPDGTFRDAKSGRSYRVYRRSGQFRHRESIRTDDGQEIVLSDFPVRYVIGSGRFSRSYLVESDGFLLESPITWYAARQQWAISPGYDQFNPGFERSSQIRCIRCHVGRAEAVDGSPHRVRILSNAIDCERCHGPGSLHVQRWEQQTATLTTVDPTIVHPGRLSRERNEDICAQCHLHSAATVDVRGRGLASFRPGLALAEFCIHYGSKKSNKPMQVVGHVEQMRLSRCYQASKTLTCTTCHDPHQKPKPALRLAYYRSKCLGCHTEDSCGIERPQRLLKNEHDDCIACHMPTVPTEIPHFAFTHHRIAIHTSRRPAKEIGGISSLVSLGRTSHLPQVEQDRCLGLAYAQAADDQRASATFRVYVERARKLLEDVRRRGIRDAQVDAALAKLYWQRDPRKTIALSKSALEYENLPPDARVSALFTLGSTLFEMGNTDRAIRVLEKLVRLRRYSIAWFVLSRCYERAGNSPKALAAARKAVEISPQNPQFHRHLADLYRASGKSQEAEFQSRRAAALSASSSRVH